MAHTSSSSVSDADHAGVAEGGVTPMASSFFTRIAGKLLLYTVGMVLLVQILLFPLLLAECRSFFIQGRVQAADLIALNAQGHPGKPCQR